MTDLLLEGVVRLLARDLNVTDTRIGSNRDGSNSTNVKNVLAGTNSASFATLFATLVPVSVYAAVCGILFIVGRRFCPRVYYPRTFLSRLEPHERSPPLPTGWFNWIIPFWKTPDIEILNRSSLDGFLFLRYIKMMMVVCILGMCITWPVLFPIHIMGGGGMKQLDMLTIGNVKRTSWLWTHALVAWVFFGFILYMIARESVYFINLRQAYLLSPRYAERLSSRTVMFTCVPTQILDEKKLRRIFGDAVKNVWIPRDTDDLDELVKERDQTAERLERAEILLIKKANLACRQALKAGQSDIEYKSTPTSPRSSDATKSREVDSTMNVTVTSRSTTSSASPASPRELFEIIRSNGPVESATKYGPSGPPPDVSGSVAAQWIPASQRPTHRPIANYGRKVDTIKWTRGQLKKLGKEISKLRREYRKCKTRPLPAAFVEFHTQIDAQNAYQTLTHHRANHMKAEIVGVRPEEIYWNSMYFKWWERILRRFLIQGFVVAMVIFFALPAALVGIISNIKFLTEKVKFLGWINKLPSPILGLISGLLPAVALSMLMAIVPMVMRACARQSGVATESRIELFVQNSYFLFQVIQVFLVTTITSAASAALTDLIKNPLSARYLLSQNLPKASNFYISYFLLQGLAMSATRIVHLGGVVRHKLMGYAGGRPRIIARRYHRLRKIHWGSVFPMFTNMVVIAITYSLIAPIVLGVATFCLFMVYASYRYNLLYVYSSERDSRGLLYPRALKQTLTGVYLAEVCLLGLLGLKGAYGPVVITFGLIICTTLIHVSLNNALMPLLYTLPRTLVVEEELRKAGTNPYLASNLEEKTDAEPQFEDPEDNGGGYDSDFDPSDATETHHGTQSSRELEGADRVVSMSGNKLKTILKAKYQATPIPAIINYLDFWSYWIWPDPQIKKPNFVLKFMHPEIFADYHILRDMMPDEIRNVDVSYDETVLKDAYNPPSMRSKSPRLWLPRDPACISKQEVDHCQKVIEITDRAAWIDEDGVLSLDLEGETERWTIKEWERVKF